MFELVVVFSLSSIVRRHVCSVFFFQAEDGIRDLVRSRGLGDVYKRQDQMVSGHLIPVWPPIHHV